MLNLVKKISTNLEESSAPLFYFFFSFFFVVSLRNFSELFSTNMYISAAGFVHLYAFWFSLAPAIILILYSFSNIKIKEGIKVVLPFFALINLAPLLDKLLSGGPGFKMAYMFPDSDIHILKSFFTFFGEFTGAGITPGIRIEIAIILLLSFLYLKTKSNTFSRSILATFIVYFVIFVYLAFPFVLDLFFNTLSIKYQFTNSLMSSSFVLLSVLLWGLVATLASKKYFFAICSDIRLSRLLHFQAMFVFGTILGLNHYSAFSISPSLFFQIIFSSLAILFAWVFSVMSNNIYDIDIDKTSSPNRPLFRKDIDINLYQNISWFILFLSLFLALLAGFKVFFFILLFIGNYFLYSLPPFRLKRVPLFSKFIIALNSLIILLIGYTLIGHTSIKVLPSEIIFFFLLNLSLIINFIDLKDYEADKANGIVTIPGLLGLKLSKLFIGISFFVSNIMLYFFFRSLLVLFLSTVFGALEFYLLNKKDYREGPLFYTYLLSLLFLFIFLLSPFAPDYIS